MEIQLSLPSGSSLLAKLNSNIDLDQSLYEISSTKDESLSLFKALNIKPNQIYQYCLKVIGETVEEGEIIATRKTFIGSKEVISPCSGTITNIDHEAGIITISCKLQSKSTGLSYFKGKIKSYDSLNRILTVEIKEGFKFPLKKTSYSNGGEVFYMDNKNSYFSLREEDVNNKIIVTEHITPQTETKLDALSARGVLYLKGESEKILPCWKIKLIEDYTNIMKSKYKYICLSGYQEVGIFYNS